MKLFSCFLILLPLALLNTLLQAQQAEWKVVRENFCGTIALDPTTTDIVYVSAHHAGQLRFYKSTNAGETWTSYPLNYTEFFPGGIVIDPSNPRRLWLYGGYRIAIVRSDDGGLTTTRADSGISYDGHYGYGILGFAHDYERQILYASEGTFHMIYRSFDYGNHWEVSPAFRTYYPFSPGAMLVLPENGWVYCCTRGEIRRSKDFGVTWEALSLPILPRNEVAIMTRVPGSKTFYALVERNQIYKSYNLGETWEKVSAVMNDSTINISALAVSALDTNLVFAGAAGAWRALKGGFFVSRDAGVSWQTYHLGLPQYELTTYSVLSLAQTKTTSNLYMSMGFFNDMINTCRIYRLSEQALTSVNDRKSELIPKHAILSQNYPNPFNAQTKVEFSIPRSAHVALAIYNLSGAQIISLLNGFVDAGSHKVIWNGENAKGKEVTSGIYFYSLKTPNKVITRKLLLIR